MRPNTSVTEFVLLGFSNDSDVSSALFFAFLCIYIFIMLGNVLIIVVTTANPALHTPMYSFLRILSFLEICFTSVTLPNVLAEVLWVRKTMSFAGCAVQMYFFLFFGVTECCLLASMAYDRYCAICNPLHYVVSMDRKVCLQLTGGSWLCGMVVAVGHTTFVFTLPFCGPNVIDHFFCEIQPVLKLVCGDTSWIELQIIVGAALVLLLPFVLTLGSYVCIISTILQIRSTEGQRRAFSTCSSHLTVVTLFYGSALIMYVRPKASFSPEVSKLLALFYSVVIPLLNPVIYSLRNKEVKDALRKTGKKLCHPQV